MSKQTALKVCKDHLNYLVHLQQRQNDPSITKTLSSVINDQMDDDPEWQHMQYLRSLRNGNK
jgi:hypothetical protein